MSRKKKSGLLLALLAMACVLRAQKTIGREEVLADPAWLEEYRFFIPDPTFLHYLDGRLGEEAGPVEIDVYFAFWCEDSRREVPRMQKIVDSLMNKGKVTLRFLETARKASREQKYYVAERQIERIPTFVCSRGGREIGRIVEWPQSSLVEDLLTIVF